MVGINYPVENSTYTAGDSGKLQGIYESLCPLSRFPLLHARDKMAPGIVGVLHTIGDPFIRLDIALDDRNISPSREDERIDPPYTLKIIQISFFTNCCFLESQT